MDASANVEQPIAVSGNMTGLPGVTWNRPWTADAFGPTAALLGDITGGVNTPRLWMEPVTENPAAGTTEEWEIHNFTVDAHPIHIHLVQFQVIGRFAADGTLSGPEPGETGFKDTVIAYPGEVTKVIATFRHPRPVRVALPHRRARGQRDDAAVRRRISTQSQFNQMPGTRKSARHLAVKCAGGSGSTFTGKANAYPDNNITANNQAVDSIRSRNALGSVTPTTAVAVTGHTDFLPALLKGS